VQSARVPSIRQLNPAVPVELERVMMKALTEDPAQRYQRARLRLVAEDRARS